MPYFIQQGWRYYPVKGHTAYKIISMDDRLAIQATSVSGAGGLIGTCRRTHRPAGISAGDGAWSGCNPRPT